MKDFLGQELFVGDNVVCLSHSRTSSQLVKGTITKFTNSMLYYSYSRKYPENVVRISPNKVVKYSQNGGLDKPEKSC